MFLLCICMLYNIVICKYVHYILCCIFISDVIYILFLPFLISNFMFLIPDNLCIHSFVFFSLRNHSFFAIKAQARDLNSPLFDSLTLIYQLVLENVSRWYILIPNTGRFLRSRKFSLQIQNMSKTVSVFNIPCALCLNVILIQTKISWQPQKGKVKYSLPINKVSIMIALLGTQYYVSHGCGERKF